MAIPIVISTLGTADNGMERRMKVLETRGRIEIMLTIAFLRSARIFRRVLETRGTCFHLNSF